MLDLLSSKLAQLKRKQFKTLDDYNDLMKTAQAVLQESYAQRGRYLAQIDKLQARIKWYRSVTVKKDIGKS